VKLSRHQFLHLAAGAAALPAVSRVARAQTYPTRPVRVIVGFPAGGGSDIIARLMGQWLSERLGRQFVIDNRPGAGSNIATEAVLRAPADGYTLLLVDPPKVINATLYEKLNFNFIRDIAPVASLVRFPMTMEVNPSVPVKTVPEFIAYAKANPGKINMASSGIGTLSHVTGELFKMMTGFRTPATGECRTAFLAGIRNPAQNPTPSPLPNGSVNVVALGRNCQRDVPKVAYSQRQRWWPSAGGKRPPWPAASASGSGHNLPLTLEFKTGSRPRAHSLFKEQGGIQ
jgi:hypothetical protein